eukprot:scaffold232952_cov54-Attheya_sp.AAC.1
MPPFIASEGGILVGGVTSPLPVACYICNCTSKPAGSWWPGTFLCYCLCTSSVAMYQHSFLHYSKPTAGEVAYVTAQQACWCGELSYKKGAMY